MKPTWKILLVALIGLSTFQVGTAQEIVAVLSSDSGHYKEAFDGFQEALGQQVPVTNLQSGKPRIADQESLVIAFGGKAALAEYPTRTSVIACMAPGLEIREPAGAYVYIEMAPQADLLFANLKNLQPSLKNLVVFWESDSIEDYIQQLQQASHSVGIELNLIKIDDPSTIPKRLREIQGKADALLLPPDPILVNSQNFTTIKDFSWDNHIPFYVPTVGLVEMGGTASISSSFKEIGHTAAKVAQNMLNGKSTEGTVYTEKVGIAINMGVAKNANLIISPELLQKMDKVFQ